MIASDLGQVTYAQVGPEPASVSTGIEQMDTRISEIRNLTVTEMALLNEMSLTSTKLATQSAYTAMSVFFLGISLVIFGLRLTTRSIGHMGKYFIVMIWALTLPVVVLIGLYQVGVVSGRTVVLADSDEPFFLLSFLMYIPIGIVLFLLLAERRIAHTKAIPESPATETDVILRLERLANLKEKDVITEQEFQKLKAESVATFTRFDEPSTKFGGSLKGSESSA
jgi:hypothetical protein